MPARFDLDFPAPPRPTLPNKETSPVVWILGGICGLLVLAVAVMGFMLGGRRSAAAPAATSQKVAANASRRDLMFGGATLATRPGAGLFGSSAPPPSPYPQTPAGAVGAPVGTVVGPGSGVPAYAPTSGAAPYPGSFPPPTGAVPQASGAPLTPQNVIARVKASTVLILALKPGGLASGTGFVVGPGQIATCAHVVDGASRIVIFTAGGVRFDGAPGGLDLANDVAVVSCPGGQLPPMLPLGNSDAVQEGDDIRCTGYPIMFSMLAEGFTPTASTTKGNISAKRIQNTVGAVIDTLQIDAPINPGNSGGPVYSISDGSIIGVAQSVMTNTQGVGFATPINHLRRLLGR